MVLRVVLDSEEAMPSLYQIRSYSRESMAGLHLCLELKIAGGCRPPARKNRSDLESGVSWTRPLMFNHKDAVKLTIAGARNGNFFQHPVANHLPGTERELPSCPCPGP